MLKQKKKMLKKADKGYFVGNYILNHGKVEVYVNPDTDLSEVHWPSHGRPKDICMIVGILKYIQGGSWYYIYEAVLHEVIEGILWWQGYSYEKCNAEGYDADQRYFSFDHIQFTGVCQTAAEFMYHAFMDICELCKRIRKEKSKCK